MSYVIEYRGRIITNERGAKDYIRKRNASLKSTGEWATDQDGRRFKRSVDRELAEIKKERD